MFVVSGFTGSGKTTLSAAFGRLMNTTPVRTSDFFIHRLDERRDKDGRFYAWDDRREDDLLRDHEFESGKAADKDHFDFVQGRSGGIHESIALPILLTPTEELCRIFLDVDAETRLERAAARHGICTTRARALVEKKDAQTRLYVHRAYGYEVGSSAHLDYYDIILRIRGEVSEVTKHSVTPENDDLFERATTLVTEAV